MRTLNLGILAHVDAGKTTLTERLLFTTGAIDHIGSVDAGTTQTDSLDLERERGITIRSAVASFLVGDLSVNLVDTPGHPDFIAEVERVLGVLDGAVLVVSAVEGVQPQTPLLFRALERLRVPTLIFVNKIDRAGADPERVVEAMRRRLAPGVLPMGTVRDAGTPAATFVPFIEADGAARTALAETLAEHDEAILRAYVGDESTLRFERLREQLAVQTRDGTVHPVFFGSAARGAGVDALLASVDELLSAPRGDPEAPVSGRVFKIERTASGERVAYVRLFAGTLRARQRVTVGGGEDAKPTAIRVFAPTGAPRRDHLAAGEMATVRGLGAVRVGDAIGEPPPGHSVTARFPRPTLEAVVFAVRPEEQGSLRAALNQLAEQDPLIDVRQDDLRHEIAVSLYGEVQKEVIGATLERDYGISADFRETTTVCIERPARAGEAEEILRAKTKTNITGRSSPLSTNPFRATLALRIEPAAAGSGIEVRVDVEPRLLPLYLFKTPEVFTTQLTAHVHEALSEGLAGWQVTDCRVTVSDCGYGAPATNAGDYRHLTELVLATALERAGTWVCEPLAELSLEIPTSTAPGVLAALGRLGGRVTGQFSANGVSRAGAVLPVARVRSLQHQLPGLSMGEGILETRFAGYQPIGANPPTKPRTRPSPLDRAAWLVSLAKRG
jgi:ribosomal protection tetracycline resistance protein